MGTQAELLRRQVYRDKLNIEGSPNHSIHSQDSCSSQQAE